MVSDFNRLVIYLMSREAIPKGGGFQDGIDFLADPNVVRSVAQKCTNQANDLCQAIMNTPDNPYGDDKDKIAAEILRRIENKKGGSDA